MLFNILRRDWKQLLLLSAPRPSEILKCNTSKGLVKFEMAKRDNFPSHYGKKLTHYGTGVTHYGNLPTHYDTAPKVNGQSRCTFDGSRIYF